MFHIKLCITITLFGDLRAKKETLYIDLMDVDVLVNYYLRASAFSSEASKLIEAALSIPSPCETFDCRTKAHIIKLKESNHGFQQANKLARCQ